jgi:hypothetical protein
MTGYGQCPRCGTWTFEHLQSYSHCWECNFVPDDLKPKTRKDFERQRHLERSRLNEELMFRSMMLVRGLI